VKGEKVSSGPMTFGGPPLLKKYFCSMFNSKTDH